MYKKLIRPLFFLFDPENIHHFVFSAIKLAFKVPFIPSLIRKYCIIKDPKLQRTVFGITFSNPVGLAAGFDKDALLFNELADFGFGFVEIGTVTPLPQSGNAKPRMFRLKKDQGLINRMGFNNEGVDAAVNRLKNRKTKVIIGGNIGKNKITPNELAYQDYEICFEKLFPVVDYFVVNVSSPNTPGLRALQDKEPLLELLNKLQIINNKKSIPKPILLKIAPDLNQQELDDIIDIIKTTQLSGVVATNTTISREGLVSNYELKNEAGGLSGKPLTSRSTEVIRYLHSKSGGAFPIIAVGGVFTAEDAIEKLEAGASLVQVYTGFIYEGPMIAKNINAGIIKKIAEKK